MFPPLAAYTALHLVLAGIALVAFFGVARELFGRNPALVASFALGSHPFFLHAVTRNFVDGFGIAYFLLALLAATKAAGGRSWLGFAAAGALSVAVVGSNLFYIVLLPWIVGHAHVVRHARGERSGPREALAYVAGAGALLLALGAVNAWFGGSWFFLKSSIRFFADFTAKPSTFVKPVSEWLWGATWLAVPAALFFASAASLVRRHDSRPPLATYAHAQWLMFAVLMTALQFGSHTPVLQYPFYASLLLPPAFLALAAMLAHGSEIGERPAWLLVALIVGFALAAASPLGSNPPTVAGREILLPLAAASLVPLLVSRRASGLRSAVGVLAALTFCQWLATGKDFDREWDRYTTDRRGVFVQVVDAVAALGRLDPGHTYRFWYDKNEPGGLVFDSIAHTRLGCANIWSDRFPRTNGGVTCAGDRVRSGMKVAVLSRHPNGVGRARQALRTVGLDATLVDKAEVEGPIASLRIWLILLR